MEFSLFLSNYYPDTSYPAQRLFDDMLEQAHRAEALGFRGVTIPEHHFMNILMNPAPLPTAVAVASVTERIAITTAVLVLPFMDMKRAAGEIAVTDILTGGRLCLGLGRGGFVFEFERFGVPAQETREKFDESLEVLRALLTREEVSWDGKYYKFAPLTIMPRPLQKPSPPMLIAALAPTAIYHSARRGFHVQTTPLQGSGDLVRQQAEAFRRGTDDAEEAGKDLRLSMLRVGFIAEDEADARKKQRLAYGYYQRFDNVFTGPGEILNGAITPLPREQSVEQLAENLLVGTAEQIVEKLERYHELGIDEINLNMNIGASAEEALESMQRFAADVMPHFRSEKESGRAA